MASRKIKGTTHIRRKLRTRAKVAIGTVALAILAISGYLFATKTVVGNRVVEKITQVSEIGESHGIDWFGEGPGGTSGKVGSIIQVSAYSVVEGAGAGSSDPGCISGLGSLMYGEGGNSTVIKAKAFTGYEFVRWERNGVSGVVSTNSNLTVKYGDVYSVSDSVVTITESTNFKAVFKKKEVAMAPTSGTIPFYFDMYPAIGMQTLDAETVSGTFVQGLEYNGHVESTLNNGELKSITAGIMMPYAEAIAAFPHDIGTHTAASGSSSDSTPTGGYIRAAFYVYIIEGGEKVYERRVEKNVTITDANDEQANVEFKFKFPDILERAHGNINKSVHFIIIPLTQQGTSYQVITESEDTMKGFTSGDSSSGKPFSTTVSAIPNEGYEFDYWTKIGLDGKESDVYSKENKIQVKCEGIDIYKAYFKEAKYKITANNILPSDGGTVIGTGEFKWHDNVDLTLTPAPGYRIESWSYTTAKGGTYSGSTDTIHIEEIEEDINVTVKFTNGKARIDVKASPVDGGTAEVQNFTIGGLFKPDYEEFVPGKEDALLVATPASGYKFLYWKDSQDRKYAADTEGGNTLTLVKVASSEKFTACFAPKAIRIETKVNPTGAGDVDVSGDTINPLGENKYEASPATAVTFKATEATGYHFQKFVDDEGKEYTSNPLVKSDMIKDITLTAIFVEDEFDISAIASPSTGGQVTVNGRAGSNSVHYNQNVDLIATPNTAQNYMFRYFEDQNGNKYSGEPGTDSGGNKIWKLSFSAVNGAETYKAVFGLAKVSLNVKVDEVVSAGASYKTGGYRVDYTSSDSAPIVPGPYHVEKTFDNVAGGKSVKITAVPGDGYHFAKFVDTDGNVYTENPLIYPDLSENKEVEIIFVPDSFTIYANATPVTGGKTQIKVWDKNAPDGSDPKATREGSCEVGYGDKVEITAIASGDFIFRHFEDPNGTKYGGSVAADKKSATFTFKAVNGAETYKAVFGMDEAEVSVKVDPNTTKTVGVEEKYVAGHAEVTYTKKSDGASDTKVMDYGAPAITDIKGGTSVKIKAVAGDGYHFAKFVDTDGNVYTENPLVYPDLYEKKDVEIIFVPDTFTIKANATPVTGGSVDVVTYDNSGNELSRREGSNDVSYEQSVRVVAKPNGNFAFRYFEDPNGSKYAPTGYEKDKVNPSIEYPYFEFNAVNGSETYKAVFAMESVNVKVKVDPNKTTLFGNYKAGGYRIDYTNTAGKTDTTGEVYSASAAGITAKGQTSVKITAIPGDGYHFSKFVDTDGNTFNENPLVYPDLVENKDVEVIYVPDTFTINAQATPVIGGTADVTAGGSTREGSNTVSYDQEVTITAKPRPGFAFRYFEDPNGSKYSGEDIGGGNYAFTFRAVNGSETYKVVFAMDTVKLNVKVDPGTTDPSSGTYIAGKFEVNYTYTPEDSLLDVNKTVEGSRPNFSIDNIKGQTSVKIKAIELGGYKFSKFIDSEGNVWNDNPMVLGDLIENKEIEIIFVQDHWRIEGQSSPEAGGRITFNGIESGIDVDYGDHVLMEAKPNPGYEFKYFKDSNGNEFLSNPIEFDAINGSEKYTAYFVKNDVSVTIDLTPSGSGTVRFNEEPAVSTRTTYSADGRSNVRLTANPKEDHKFVNWKDQDGNTYPDNPLTIVDISRDLVFTAVFDSDSIGVKAVASPASGGHIRKLVNDDGSITLIASANRGYKFANWKKGEKLLTMGTKYTVGASDVHDGDVYTAYFKIDKDYDAKSDITKEKFYREWRKVLTPNYTVTRDSMKLLAMQTVAGLRQYDDATPALKSYGAVAEAQAYFDEKTAKDAARLDGIFGDSELMSAEGEELTPDKLPDYAEYEEIANEFTDKKFGDRYETEILTVKRVVQPEGFNNTKRTYLWRYTGAEYKDNIYLLYNIGGSKHDWATPIVDEDGVLKFTIDKLDDRDVVAVVRVKVK